MFEGLFGGPAVVEATDERAWLEAMLEVEAALTRACAAAGLVPHDAAETIVAACRPGLIEPTEIWRQAVTSATPVVALVDALRAAVPPALGPYVHCGATSQDIIDTALMLVAARAIGRLGEDLDACAGVLAELAAAHERTPQLGRTLLQPATPMTFGAAVGAWLAGLRSATAGLRRWRPAVQLGGAVGTRAELGAAADPVATAVAEALGLDAAPPWHTDRTRVVELGSALGSCAGALAKIAGDVILLSQAEIGELAEGRPGRSSAMPDKRNPARAVIVVACAHRVPALVGTLFAGMPQELQRAAGRWQAEWPTVTDLLRLVGGAAHHARAMLTELRVDAERMADRLARTTDADRADGSDRGGGAG
jgi:3-carboxy-cis,cis-muconate cycloisomerase